MSIFDKVEDFDRTIFDRLQQEFFIGNPVVGMIDFEAQGLTDDNQYLLGCRVGPSLLIEGLTHEMAHLAEREIDKLLQKPNDSWGFSFGKYWNLGGRDGFEAINDKAVQREMRVWAYQIHLNRYIGYQPDLEGYVDDVHELVSSVKYMDAFLFYEIRVFGKKKWKALGYEEAKKQAVLKVREEVIELSETKFTYEKFVENWNLRMRALAG